MSTIFPPGAWDTHVHVFDPVNFPYKADRAYTPRESSLKSLVEDSEVQNFLLVQASIEDGPDSVLHQLQLGRDTYPGRQFRGEIIWDDRAAAIGVDALHEMGIRCLRLHGKFGNGGSASGQNLTESEWTVRELRALRNVAAQKGWSVAAQLSMDLWIDVAPPLLALNVGCDRVVPLIAEHVGSPPPSPLSEAETVRLEIFAGLLGRAQGFYVKLSALHRRVSPDAGIESMAPVISLFKAHAPDALLYGSDFPHVNSSAAGLMPSDPLAVEQHAEALVMKGAMSEIAWNRMVVETPRELWAEAADSLCYVGGCEASPEHAV